MYQRIIGYGILLLLALPASRIVRAQPDVILQSSHPLALPGGGLLVIDPDASEREARVADVVPPSNPQATRPDIKTGDVILYVNGKRIRSGKELEAAYRSIKTGTEVKLGIRRGEGTLIAAFVKPEATGGGQQHRIQIGPGSAVLAGYLVSDEAGRVMVGRRLPLPEENQPPLRTGDQILAINDHSIGSASQIRDLIEGLADGTVVRLKVKRSGKTIDVSFKKTTPPGRIIRKTN